MRRCLASALFLVTHGSLLIITFASQRRHIDSKPKQLLPQSAKRMELRSFSATMAQLQPKNSSSSLIFFTGRTANSHSLSFLIILKFINLNTQLKP
jgi:hypothetical protein